MVKPESKHFAKLDAIQGYFQIPLDEESSKLTTFLLPMGRFRYTRAPMGLNASGDEWCARSDHALAGLQGVTKLVDDILIQAATEEELFQRIREVLQRCRDHGIYISERKIAIGSSIKFAGHIISDQGVLPDNDKVAAITDFPTPKNIHELRSFLGLANQLGQFVPDLAHNTVKMRSLLKKDAAYVWLPFHEQEFQRVKRILTGDLIVKFFDPTQRTQLLTDASRLNGLGYALI